MAEATPVNNQQTSEQHDALQTGIVLRDYTIQRAIGQGGFGITYLAHDSVFDRPVAMKEFLPTDIARRFGDSRVGPRATKFRESYEWGLGEFLEEAKLIDRLEHPNVVRVRSFFRDNDTAYLVMEYVEGPTLAAWLQSQGSPSSADLIAMLRALSSGLEHIHSRGCLHRDIKPDNIILRAGSVAAPVLIDFGAARKAVAERTRSIAAIVSAGYTPLEQYSSHRTLTPATDLYALCAVAYRCITGEEPPAATDRAIADTLPRLVERGAGRFPAELLQALDAGLALRVTDRPATLDVLRAALGESVSAPAPPVPASTPAAEPTGAAAMIARSAERDRNRKTMKVDYTEEPERRREPAVPAAIEPAGPRIYPRPISVCVLALLVGLASYWRLSSDSDAVAAHAFAQAVLAFPLAAYVGTWLVQRFLARAGATILRRVAVTVATYIAVSLLSNALYAVLTMVNELGMYGGPSFHLAGVVTFYFMLMQTAPAGFVAFGLALICLHALGDRLRWAGAAGPRRLVEPAAMAPALLLIAFVIALPNAFTTARSRHIASSLRTELYRTGNLLSDDDEALQAAIRAIESGGVASDSIHQAVYEWAREQPTREQYTVTPEGSGDFATIGAALAHLARVPVEKRPGGGFTVQVLPGAYRENVRITVPVTLTGEGGPVIQGLGNGEPALDIGGWLGEKDNVVVQGFTVSGSARGQSLVQVMQAATVRLERNTFDAGSSSDRCIVFISKEPWSKTIHGAQISKNTFHGYCGVEVAGKATPGLTDNSFDGVAGTAVFARGESSTHVIGGSYGAQSTALLAKDRATASLRGGGTVRGRTPLVVAEGFSRVDLWKIALDGSGLPGACISASNDAAVELHDVQVDCHGNEVLFAVNNAKITLQNTTFKLYEHRGSDPRNYVFDSGGKHISLGNTVVRP